MALVNASKREVNVKIVYTGLPHVGKTANLSLIYQRLKPEFRGQERLIPMGGCAMHLCEFQLPGAGALPGFATRYHVYTLSGADIGEEQWRMVLKGADGIVFVVDPEPSLALANREAFASLRSQLIGMGVDLAQLPIVVQANSSQLAGPSHESEVLRQLAAPGLTMISANVERGEGVLETLTTLVRKMTATLQKLEVPPTPDSTTPGEDEEVDDLELAAELADDLLSTPIDADPESGVAEEVRQTITVPLALQADGEVLELPVRLTVAGIEKEYLLTIALREAGAVPSPPLRGAAYVR